MPVAMGLIRPSRPADIPPEQAECELSSRQGTGTYARMREYRLDRPAPQCDLLVSRFRRLYHFAARARRNVGTKGTLATIDSSVALDLTFLRMTRGNAGRNVKSATLAAAGTREDQLVGGREVEARLDSEQGCNTADDRAPDRHRVPARGGEALRLGQRLRLIEHDQNGVARGIGGQDCREASEDLGLGIAAGHHLFGCAGLAADIIAFHVGT